MRIMKSMGVNALRTSHNPPSPELIDVCQRLGIVMMDEAFDTWRTPKVEFDYGRFFDANSDADVKEMVERGQELAVGDPVVDRERDPGLDPSRGRRDGPEADRGRPLDRHQPPDRDGARTSTAASPPRARRRIEILELLDGLGLNYNTAGSVDALHARYPDKFFFESESSSETSTRGVYQDPDQLNTGENFTPNRRDVSSYDNNLESWTMSGEYGLKKDRDRPYFAGEFLWSGMDYIGEPTPYYDVFPVKTSFFGAVDTAGFPKDQYYLFKSQWTDRPMVHLLPMDWTRHEPGETVQVRAYSNVDSVELYLNGRSLGERRFDRKRSPSGESYLETTEATHDDKTVPGGPFPGSYTSPNGSAGHLYLRWDVPFERGRLEAVARRGGSVVARDAVVSAGAPFALRLCVDRRAGRGPLSYVTADVVDRNGVLVPGADNLISWDVSGGGWIAGLDNGREEDPEGFKGTAHTAFNGKALAIVHGGRRVTATRAGAALRLHRVSRAAVDRSRPRAAARRSRRRGSRRRPPTRATPAPRTRSRRRCSTAT